MSTKHLALVKNERKIIENTLQ